MSIIVFTCLIRWLSMYSWLSFNCCRKTWFSLSSLALSCSSCCWVLRVNSRSCFRKADQRSDLADMVLNKTTEYGQWYITFSNYYLQFWWQISNSTPEMPEHGVHIAVRKNRLHTLHRLHKTVSALRDEGSCSLPQKLTTSINHSLQIWF